MIERFLAVSGSAVIRMALVGLVGLGLQTTILNELRPYDVCLQSMLLLSACAGLAKGSETGAIAGFAFGYMYDMVLTSPLGLSGVVFAATGYVAGTANNFVHESTWWSRMIIGPVACMLGSFVMPVALEMVGIEGSLTGSVFRVAAVVGISSAMFTEPGVRVCRWALGVSKESMAVV